VLHAGNKTIAAQKGIGIDFMGLLKKLVSQRSPSGRNQALPPLKLRNNFTPAVSGILAYPDDQIHASIKVLRDRIRLTVRYADEHYYQYYEPVLLRLISTVHLLPGSLYHHHRGVGGLLMHSLEAGLHALHLHTNGLGLKLTKEGQERRDAEPRWDLASFIVGVGHDLGKVMTDMEIYDDTKNLRWNPAEKPLNAWLKDHDIKRYQVKFLPNRHKKHETISANMTAEFLLTPDIKKYLLDGDRELLQLISSGISGDEEHNLFRKYAVKADQASVSNYMKFSPHEPSPAINAGMAPFEHLDLAMKRLFFGGDWKVNAPGGIAWLIEGHLYLVWPRAAKELRALLIADGVPGIPQDPDSLAKLLLEVVIIEECEHKTPYWLIAPDGSTLKAVRLSLPARWLKLLPAKVSDYKSKEPAISQKVSAEKIVLGEQNRDQAFTPVQRFLQVLKSPDPPFPVQAFGPHLYTSKREAEKWFAKNGVSGSQMLGFVKDELLGLIHMPDGADPLIGPPI
jgi:hypothetical protein